jgi:hypothetical protein
LNRVAPGSPVQECWVEFNKNTFDAGRGAVAAALTSDSRIIAVRDLVSRNEFTRTPDVEFANRPQRYWWLPIGLIVGAVAWAGIWFRRGDAAIYLATGMTRGLLAALFTIEFMAVVLSALVLGASWAVLAFWVINGAISPNQLLIAIHTAGLASAAAVTVASAGFALGTLGQRANMLKDR